MKLNRDDLLLYLVTDRRWLEGETLSEVVEQALKGNVTFIQLREKDLSDEEFKALAVDIKKVADRYKVPFVINDNVKVAMEVGADGVHIGQGDIEASEARKILGKDKILGVSANNVIQAKEAERAGADYLGIGAVFSTDSKPDATDIEIDDIRRVTKAVNIPAVGIGGINKHNIYQLKESGLNGIAVISAILAQRDIKQAANDLYKRSEEIFSESSNI